MARSWPTVCSSSRGRSIERRLGRGGPTPSAHPGDGGGRLPRRGWLTVRRQLRCRGIASPLSASVSLAHQRARAVVAGANVVSSDRRPGCGAAATAHMAAASSSGGLLSGEASTNRRSIATPPLRNRTTSMPASEAVISRAGVNTSPHGPAAAVSRRLGQAAMGRPLASSTRPAASGCPSVGPAAAGLVPVSSSPATMRTTPQRSSRSVPRAAARRSRRPAVRSESGGPTSKNSRGRPPRSPRESAL